MLVDPAGKWSDLYWWRKEQSHSCEKSTNFLEDNLVDSKLFKYTKLAAVTHAYNCSKAETGGL